MNAPGTSPQPPKSLVLLAFVAIYVVWGSTYFAIRLVVESMPPFLSAAFRFCAAGAVLFIFLAARGVAYPTRGQWRHALVTGTLLLLGGNGLVAWSEQSISSGLAALLVALAPIWFALLDWARPGGQRPRLRTSFGIVIGFLGVALLVQGRSGADHGEASFYGVLAVIAAGISWAAGSLYTKHSANAASPWMNAAAQMLCGGVALALAGTVLGEPFRTDWSKVTNRSLAALLYLIVFGSWIGFSAYVWLLKVSTPSKVSTYAYVNPVIAVFLGWAFLHETVTWPMLWGALVVLAGVIVITCPEPFIERLKEKLTNQKREKQRRSISIPR